MWESRDGRGNEEGPGRGVGEGGWDLGSVVTAWGVKC
jgi:hypothetical protein